jgi:GAF domain-containing protein
MVNYDSLCVQLRALTENIPHQVANLANASALLWQHLPDINWAGFYKMEDGILVLGPFQGKPACIEIKVGRGVCGTAVAEDQTQLVCDVHEFPGHIACDAASNSEIVVPIHVNGVIWGVLDIDSPNVGRFTEADRKGLERFVKILEQVL